MWPIGEPLIKRPPFCGTSYGYNLPEYCHLYSYSSSIGYMSNSKFWSTLVIKISKKGKLFLKFDLTKSFIHFFFWLTNPWLIGWLLCQDLVDLRGHEVDEQLESKARFGNVYKFVELLVPTWGLSYYSVLLVSVVYIYPPVFNDDKSFLYKITPILYCN